MKTSLTLIAALVLVSATVSCNSRELTRDEAKRLIEAANAFPQKSHAFPVRSTISQGVPNAASYALAGYDPTSYTNIMALCMDHFGEITGVSMGEDSVTARVEYTVREEPTPFASAGGANCAARTLSANFRRYDDGWRIEPSEE